MSTAPHPARIFFLTLSVGFVAVLSPQSASAQIEKLPTRVITDNQFGPPPAPDAFPFQFDNIKGEWVNYETPLEKPVLIYRVGERTRVAVINEPDECVELFDLDLNRVAEVPVGLGPAALAQPRDSEELWVTCHQAACAMVIQPSPVFQGFEVSQVVRPTIPPGGTGAGSAAHPAGIVFDATGSTGWIASSSTDAFVRVDRTTLPYSATVVSGSFTHNNGSTRMKEPRSLAFDPATGIAYVGGRRSGNGTFAVNVASGPLLSGLILLATQFGLNLHDVDVQAIDSATGAVQIGQAKRGIGTLIFNLATHPNGNLIITHSNAENGNFIGEASFPGGQVVGNRMTIAAPGETAPPYTAVVDLDATGTPLAMPTDIAFDGAGRIFLAAYASSVVGVFDAAGTFLGSIPTRANPRGLAVFAGDAGQETLYVMSRGDNAVQSFDISGGAIPSTFTRESFLAFDPTYDRVKKGRRIFNDASSSGSGTTFCGSCHQDLQADGQAWDLGKFYDTGTSQSPPQFPKDPKLAMVTQDLRSIEENPPYHWRGEQKDLEDFNGAFENLLQGSRLSDPDFECLKRYVFSAVYPANPRQRMDRFFSVAADRGLDDFHFTPYTATDTCVDCHTMPLGTDSSITDGFIHINSGLPDVIAVETTQLRGLFTKDSALQNLDPTGNFTAASTGFGASHAGNLGNSREFTETVFGNLTLPQRQDIATFQDEFDTGTAPAANYAEKIDSATVSSSTLETYLVPQANAGFCDIAFVGRFRRTMTTAWIDTGFVYDSGSGLFVPDRVQVAPILPSLTLQQFLNRARTDRLSGIVLGVPPGSGERVAVDRDRDRAYDGDETAAGLDPLNPDFDGDGFWDGEDTDPFNPGSTTGTPVLVGQPMIVYRTTNAVKICYETDLLSPSHLLFGTTPALGRVAGDPLPLPAGSNEWKRRHTVFLRLLKDATTYHFAVKTRGQNGQEWTSDCFTVQTDGDFQGPMRRVVDLAVTPNGSGSSTTFTIDCRVIDNTGVGVPNIEVCFVGTHLLPVAGMPSIPLSQANVDSVVQTDSQGLLSFTFDPAGVFSFNSGDQFEVALQMAKPDPSGNGFVPTLIDNNPVTSFFNFPESQGGPGGDIPGGGPGGAYCVRVDVP